MGAARLGVRPGDHGALKQRADGPRTAVALRLTRVAALWHPSWARVLRPTRPPRKRRCCLGARTVRCACRPQRGQRRTRRAAQARARAACTRVVRPFARCRPAARSSRPTATPTASDVRALLRAAGPLPCFHASCAACRPASLTLTPHAQSASARCTCVPARCPWTARRAATARRVAQRAGERAAELTPQSP